VLASRVVTVLVDCADHVLHHFAVLLDLAHALEVVGGLDYVLDVDARAQTQTPPEEARQVEEEREKEQDVGDPLVVAQLGVPPLCLRLGQVLVQGNVVGVRDPAH